MKSRSVKTNFIFISLRDNFLNIIFVLFAIGLVVFSKQNLEASKEGLSLWVTSVVPALLPFFIACELLSHTTIIDFLGNKLNKIMRPIFNVPGEGAFPLIMGIISGYPVGAKIVTNFRKQGICTKEEGERLLTFTNNSGPLFIIGTVGISLFGNVNIGILLFMTHLLACLTVGFLFRFWKKNIIKKKSNFTSFYTQETKIPPKISSLGSILQSSIMSSVTTIVMIGGFVMLFSVIISILENTGTFNLLSNVFSPLFNLFDIPADFLNGIFAGIVELTNGVSIISKIAGSSIYINIIICAFLLGFGGISILLQVLSITSNSDISIKPYIIGKFLQGIFASFYTYIFLNYFFFI